MYQKLKGLLTEKDHYNLRYADEIKATAQLLYGEEIKSLSYTSFRLYQQTGSRMEYEKEYMQHRRMLCAFAGMNFLSDDSRWTDRLCDIIWAVCDEYTWALPAHIGNLTACKEIVTRIDLFAGETAFGLSEILALLGDRLPGAVRARAEYELDRRIVSSYLEKKPVFGISNWSAVCGGSVGCTMLYLKRHEAFNAAKEQLLKNMQDFLDSYTPDGCCLEGGLYWQYGFSFFCYFAEMLYEYTNGEINYFEEEKVKKIAYFCQNICLGENNMVSFSDAPHRLKYESGIWNLLAAKYGGIRIPEPKYAETFDNGSRYRFPNMTRNLFWGNWEQAENSTGNAETGDHTDSAAGNGAVIFYDTAGWYINKKNHYRFAAKAGHNGEPHNHNDVGSFLVYENGDYIIDDVGWPEYTRDYFGEKRYETMCASSLGHSVPVIDGMQQKAGAERKSIVTSAGQDRFELEYSAAYGCEGLTELKRSFVLNPEEIVLTDSVKGCRQSFTDRFITRIKPEITGSTVTIRNYQLSCEQSAVTALCNFRFMERMNEFREEPMETVAYIIDFQFQNVSRAVFHLRRVKQLI